MKLDKHDLESAVPRQKLIVDSKSIASRGVGRWINGLQGAILASVSAELTLLNIRVNS